eukprot:g13390.t1 g13390   contig8:580056-581007(+)
MGFVTFVVSQPASAGLPNDASSVTQVDPELFAKAITHAKTMNISTDPKHKQHQKQHQQLMDQLQSGDVEALYTVAQSLNQRGAGDDRITSVQLWHALADGPAAHVNSAVALGFSYAEVDKETALRYFVQAGEGKQDGSTGPHQAALFNAGRLFLELNDAASSLAYIRACASKLQTPPGIHDAAEMFLYSSINEFPAPETKEFNIWKRALEYLDMYASMIHEGTVDGEISGRKKGQTYLLAAQQELDTLRNKYGGKFSQLQTYLFDIIVGRIQFLLIAMETGGSDEL